jgi:ABC-type molybdenum transport system ATPase subunit/photorepair protein PhrA
MLRTNELAFFKGRSTLNEVNIQIEVKAYLDALPTAKLLNSSGNLNAEGNRLSDSVVDFICALLDGQIANLNTTLPSKKKKGTTSVRLHAIELTNDSPVGPFNFHDLSTAHTILIVGPNGAGKSSLLNPLKTRTNAGGRAKCLNANNEVVVFDASGVQNNIAFITSVDLLSRIDSLNDALSIAAGASRFRGFVQVIKAASNRLSKLITAPTSPPSWTYLTNFIEKDKLCGTLPRTFDHYTSIGISLATAMNVGWNPVSENASDTERLDNERTLLPVAIEFLGRRKLTEILNRFESLRVDGAASRAEQALTELTVTCKTIINEYAIDLDVIDVLSCAQQLIDWLQQAIHTIEQLISARNTLKACRKLALQYIKTSQPEPTECPICDRSMVAQSVSEKLSSQLSVHEQDNEDPDPESDSLIVLRSALQLIQSSSYKAKSLVDIAGHCWTHNHQTITSVSEQLSLIPTNWHPAVRSACSEAKQMCEAWISEHKHWSAPAEASAVLTRDHLVKACKKLREDETKLNDGHDARLQHFNQLKSLGELIWIRRELNKTPWIVDADHEKKNQILQQCLSELKSLSVEYAEMTEKALSVVITDDVQGRFGQMLNKLHFAGHPDHVTHALMEGGDVSFGMSDMSNALSEGQRVLVNLAARMTVASVVIGHNDHKPGWIVFDEPTNGLDPEAVSILAEYIGWFSPQEFGGQIIVSTFDEDFASQVVKHSTASARNVKQINLQRFNRDIHEGGLHPTSIHDYAPDTN